MPQLQPELIFKALSLLLIVSLALILALSFVSRRKENQFGRPLKGMLWFTLAVICFCAIVLFADYIEKARTLEIISRRVQAMIRGF
jgi:cell division protein FtsW (lipid II flippase)